MWLASRTSNTSVTKKRLIQKLNSSRSFGGHIKTSRGRRQSRRFNLGKLLEYLNGSRDVGGSCVANRELQRPVRPDGNFETPRTTAKTEITPCSIRRWFPAPSQLNCPYHRRRCEHAQEIQ